MKISKQVIIFILLGVLSVFQIVYLYTNNTKLISFYPRWSVVFTNKKLSISTNQGFFTQITPVNDQNYMNITKQSNSLVIDRFTKSEDQPIKDIELTIKYCNNCFIIDLNHSKVFTQKNPDEDIVLKKKIIINGYSIEKKNILDLSQKNIKLVIFNPISEEMIMIDNNIAMIYINDFKKEVQLRIPNFASQKFTFF